MQFKANKARVLIVDDHPVVRAGLTMLLSREKDLTVCGESAEGQPTLEMIDKTDPSAVILDLGLSDMNGLELLKEIHKRHPNLPVLVLSMSDEMVYAERSLRAGASGFISKENALENVASALRQILQGDIFASDKVKARLLKKVSRSGLENEDPVASRLSDRELEVFDLIGQGLSTRKIAEKWNRSVKTIETYRAHLKQKLGLTDSSELVREAVRWRESRTRD